MLTLHVPPIPCPRRHDLARILMLAALGAGLGLSLAGPVRAADTTASPAAPLRQARVGVASTALELPADLTSPAGRSRWDLTGLTVDARFLSTLKEDAAGQVLVAREETGAGPARWQYSDPTGGDAALRWLYPDRFPVMLQPGARHTLELEETREGTPQGGAHLFITVETVGIGWVHLPSGPREAALQHARILRGPASSRHLEPAAELYRWVDRRAGVVAQITWPAPDRTGATSPPQVLVLEEILAGAADLKIYVDQIDRPPFTAVTYGYDKGPGTAISSLVPEAPATMGDLVALDHWDFSGNSASVVIASHATDQVNAAETCNFNECGYTLPGVGLDREDFLNLLDPNDVRYTHNVTQTEVRPGAIPPDTTIWLRAGTVNEGREASSLFATDGESRLCFVSDASNTRREVPLFRFANQDADGYYMQVGDARWTSGAFACEPNISGRVCGVLPSLVPDPIYIGGSPYLNCAGSTGSQYTDVVKAGVLTTPSGHTFNALLLRNVADFCAYRTSTCSGFLSKLDTVRTVNYLWMVPYLGTTVRLQSPQVSGQSCSSGQDPDLCYTMLETTDIKFGLFPPRSISVTGATDTTLDLSWDPGLITDRIDDYRIYWDTDSGSTGPYAFDSLSNPSQVSFAGTTATLSGLSPGTTYHVTVTSRSTFTNPKSGVVTTYESLLFPTQVSGDPSFVYPVEVQGTTTGGTCIPTAEVTALTVETLPGGETQLCWAPSADPCLAGYQVLGSASADSDAGFAQVGGTAGATCWTGSPADGYFLAVADGTGGSGPWGHYGR